MTELVRQQPRYPLPLLGGRFTAMQGVIIAVYAGLLTASNIPIFLYLSQFITSKNAIVLTGSSLSGLAVGMLWALVLFPAGSLLAGAIFGSWRGGLIAIIFSPCVLLIEQATRAFPTSNSLFFYILIPIAAFITGFFWERRCYKGFVRSLVMMEPGALLLALTEIDFSTSWDLNILKLILTVPLLIASSIAFIETVIQWIASTRNGRQVELSDE